MERSEFWQTPSAHQVYWELHNNPDIYTYDPADDGPEVEIIREAYFQLLCDGVFK